MTNESYYPAGRGCAITGSDGRLTSIGGIYAQIDFPRLVAEWVRTLSGAGLVLLLVNAGQRKGTRESEQAGTGQPDTRPESKSEGSDKPQPDSEGRSR
jgi:hypothetical protein